MTALECSTPSPTSSAKHMLTLPCVYSPCVTCAHLTLRVLILCNVCLLYTTSVYLALRMPTLPYICLPCATYVHLTLPCVWLPCPTFAYLALALRTPTLPYACLPYLALHMLNFPCVCPPRLAYAVCRWLANTTSPMKFNPFRLPDYRPTAHRQPTDPPGTLRTACDDSLSYKRVELSDK
jgi:hypothetical protein